MFHNWLRDLSIGRKLWFLSLVSVVTSGVTGACLMIGILWHVESSDSRKDATAQAEIVAENIKPAVLFQDLAVANEILAGLGWDSEVMKARLLDADGREIAAFNPQTLPGNTAEAIEVKAAVLDNGVPIATVVVQHGTQRVEQKMLAYIGIAGIASLLSMLLGALVVRRLHRVITVPLNELIALMKRVSEDGDLSARAVPANRDELGRLAASFNQMIQQIQVRDSALDVAPVAVWIAHDSQSKVITGNRLSYEWLGVAEGGNVSPAGSTEAKQWQCKVLRKGVELRPEEMPLQRAALGMPVLYHELDFVYPDGAVRHVLGNAISLHDARGESCGAVSAFVDITARRRAELVLQAAKNEAEDSNNAKSRFLAAASHDLRQPLSALSIYVNMLKKDVSPSGEAILSSMKDCLGSLSELLTDLLDLSKLDAGVVVPNISSFAVAELFSSLEAMHGPEASLKGLSFRRRPSSLTAKTDLVLFRRIVGNLVSNAIRYSRQGGVLVACRRRLGKYWVEVWDTGIGIPDELKFEIFEEFKQLDGGARNRGSGLGLAIVAKAAALLKLAILVRSRPGQGSVFAIELPLGHGMSASALAPQAAKYRALRVALVEDNEMVCKALSYGLQEAGHQVVAGTSGGMLQVRLARENFVPDIVLSDYRLTDGETGYDVIARLRARLGDELPAIILTGDTDPKLLRSMADRGIVVLHKPVDMEILEAYLEDMTNNRAA